MTFISNLVCPMCSHVGVEDTDISDCYKCPACQHGFEYDWLEHEGEDEL